MFNVGDQIVVTETLSGSGRKSKQVIRKGRVVQVTPKFLVVDNGKWKECVWLDEFVMNRCAVSKA